MAFLGLVAYTFHKTFVSISIDQAASGRYAIINQIIGGRMVMRSIFALYIQHAKGLTVLCDQTAQEF